MRRLLCPSGLTRDSVDRHSAAPLLVGVESAPLRTPIRVPLPSGSAHCQSPVGADRVRLGLPGWRIGPAVSLMCSPVGASQRFDQAVAHPAQTVRIASSALVKFEVVSVAVPNQLALGNLSGDKLSRYAAISMTLPIRCPCLARSDWGSTFVIQTCIIAKLRSETSLSSPSLLGRPVSSAVSDRRGRKLSLRRRWGATQ